MLERSGADDTLFWQTADLLCEVCHAIHRIAGNDQYTIKAACHDAFHNTLHNFCVLRCQVQTCFLRLLGSSCCNHHNTRISAIRIISCIDFHFTSGIRQAVLQIHRLSDCLFLCDIKQHQFVNSSGAQKTICHAHTDKAGTNQYDFSFFTHCEASFAWVFTICYPYLTKIYHALEKSERKMTEKLYDSNHDEQKPVYEKTVWNFQWVCREFQLKEKSIR